MSDTSCKWAGAERPRFLPGRHEDGCAGDCAGCQPCPWSHCRVCAKVHAEHTCPGCLDDARETLAEIRRLTASLPAEVLHRGIDSEAMNLLGPVADPEQTGHVRASVNVGRLPGDWLEIADHELHPLLVLGTWMEAYVEAFEHSEPARITVASAASYLDRNLSFASIESDVPFEDFARDLRQCRTHMERVLHDGEQVETGAPCMTCERRLVRVWGGGELPWTYRDGSQPHASEDCWACGHCRDWRSEQDYRLNVAETHQREAEWLTAPDMIERTGVARGSLTGWASKGHVAKRTQGGRVVYRVSDVEQRLAEDDDAA